jgi:hypothetical protein
MIKLTAALMVLTILCSCCSNPTDDEMKALTVTKALYPEFDIDLYCEFYIRVRARHSIDHDPYDQLIGIYETIIFDINKNRRKTSFVYLNYCDKSGSFQYQIAFHPREGKYKKGRSDYY